MSDARLAHLLDEPPAARREILAEDVAGAVGDVDDEVVRTLEFGHDPQHGDQETQVRRERLL
jgi:hypothetical protein